MCLEQNGIRVKIFKIIPNITLQFELVALTECCSLLVNKFTAEIQQIIW